MKLRTLFAAAAVLTSVSASAAALYDNGPDAQTDTYYTASGPYSIADSFTISSTAAVSQIDLQVDVPVGNTPGTFDWLITTSAFSGSTLASANGVSLNASLDHPWIFSGNHIGDVFAGSFAVPNLLLTPGTYWLQIQNAGFAWAQGANGMGLAFQHNSAGNTNTLISSESFAILTPEPASFVLLFSGMLVLVFARKMVRRKA